MLKKLLLFVAILGFNYVLHAQVNTINNQCWIGSGPDEAHLVIDFNDGSSRDCWIFNYSFSDSTSAQDMMDTIQHYYPWISFNLSGGFLNDIILGNQEGYGGSPFYWSTFDLDEDSNWVYNWGISTTLYNGSFFGCSYTDVDSLWNPINLPENPVQALLYYTYDDVIQWIGTGSSTALMVVDFNDYLYEESSVWGFHFDPPFTFKDALDLIQYNDYNFSYTESGGFLNDIYYKYHEGAAGSPEYWSTFTGDNPYSWIMNMGLSESIEDGKWYGCSYTPYDTSWNPVFLPENPVSAWWEIGINSYTLSELKVYPNPAIDQINIQDIEANSLISVFDLSGKCVLQTTNDQTNFTLRVDGLKAGLYRIKVQNDTSVSSTTIEIL